MRETRCPAKDIFLHTDNHPKLKRANKLIITARLLERQVQDEQEEARKLLKAEYSFSVEFHTITQASFGNLPVGTEIIHILAKLKNKDVFNAHMHLYGSISMNPEGTKSSVAYYLTPEELERDRVRNQVINDSCFSSKANNTCRWSTRSCGNL